MKTGVLSNNDGRGEAVREAVLSLGHLMVPNPASFDGLDLLIVAGWPKKLKKEEFSAPRYGTWNCHAGPVPEYRGGSPLNWQIIDGRTELGVSLLKMDEGWDTGDVIGWAKFPLLPHETIKHAHEKANRLFAELVKDALPAIDNLNMQPQPGAGTYRPQRNDAMGEIRPEWGPERVVNFVRALTHPYPGAWIRAGDGKVRVWEATSD